jgi:tol-pal system protein YbgF
MVVRLPALAVLALVSAPVAAQPVGTPSIAERIERLEAEIEAGFAALPRLPFAPEAAIVPAQWGWGQQQPQQEDNNVRLSQMEGRMRQLTGQMEQLQHQLRRLEDQLRRFQEDTEFRFQEQQNQPRRPAQRPPQQRGDAAPAEAPVSTAGLPPQPGPQLSSVQPAPVAAPPAAAPAGRQPLGAPPQTLGQVQADPTTGEPLDLVAGVRGALPQQPVAAPASAQQQVAGVGGVGIAARAAAPSNAREAYDAAYGYFLRGDYDLAQEAFQGYLTSHPRDRQAGDALYWLGESHYARRQWREAADAFLRSYTDFPQGTKAPESLLRLGMSMRQLGQQQAACASFAEVIRRYPRASQAVRQRVQTEQRGAGCA